jgi:hypothetical protein
VIRRSIFPSWTVGRICEIAKLANTPAASETRRTSGTIAIRFGNTGFGDTRGGSIRRKSATRDEASTSSDSDADSRRATSCS